VDWRLHEQKHFTLIYAYYKPVLYCRLLAAPLKALHFGKTENLNLLISKTRIDNNNKTLVQRHSAVASEALVEQKSCL